MSHGLRFSREMEMKIDRWRKTPYDHWTDADCSDYNVAVAWRVAVGLTVGLPLLALSGTFVLAARAIEWCGKIIIPPHHWVCRLAAQVRYLRAARRCSQDHNSAEEGGQIG